jgi:hypothetical protein
VAEDQALEPAPLGLGIPPLMHHPILLVGATMKPNSNLHDRRKVSPLMDIEIGICSTRSCWWAMTVDASRASSCRPTCASRSSLMPARMSFRNRWRSWTRLWRWLSKGNKEMGIRTRFACMVHRDNIWGVTLKATVRYVEQTRLTLHNAWSFLQEMMVIDRLMLICE